MLIGSFTRLAARRFSTTNATWQNRILVIADHDNKVVAPITFNTIGAAQKVGGTIDLILITDSPDNLVPQVEGLPDINKILVAKHKLFGPWTRYELMAPVVVAQHKKTPWTHIVAGANQFGKGIIPTIAGDLLVQPITGVVEILSPDTFKRPIYGGQVIATKKSKEPVKLFSAIATAFPKVVPEAGKKAPVEEVETPVSEVEEIAEKSQLVDRMLSKSERPELTSAAVVVSGGRGLKSKENFDSLINPLADIFKASIGASRAAVDAGYVTNDMQVGQSGKTVAPDLYIAVGISGAIQHLSGMKDSKTIVAINKDPEAPIFQIADYCLEADLFKAVPELNEKLKK